MTFFVLKAVILFCVLVNLGRPDSIWKFRILLALTIGLNKTTDVTEVGVHSFEFWIFRTKLNSNLCAQLALWRPLYRNSVTYKWQNSDATIKKINIKIQKFYQSYHFPYQNQNIISKIECEREKYSMVAFALFYKNIIESFWHSKTKSSYIKTRWIWAMSNISYLFCSFMDEI